MCTRLTDKDPGIKHGTLFSISGILTGLFKIKELHLETLPQLSLLLEFIHQNLALVENHRIKGYTQLAKSLCRFIQAMCSIEAPLNNNQV